MQCRCRRQCIEARALVATTCFALQVPDVKGLEDPGPPFLAQILLTQRNTYVTYT